MYKTDDILQKRPAILLFESPINTTSWEPYQKRLNSLWGSFAKETYHFKKPTTGWRGLIGSPKLQIMFHKRAAKCRSLLRKMTYKDKGSYESSPPCNSSHPTRKINDETHTKKNLQIMLQIIFHKRATTYSSLLRKMTYKHKGSYGSSPLCTERFIFSQIPVFRSHDALPPKYWLMHYLPNNGTKSVI